MKKFADGAVEPCRHASTSRLRIVHNVGALTEEASGPSYSVLRLGEALIDQGNEVALLALDWVPGSSCPAFGKVFPLGAGPRRLGRSPTMYRWLETQARAGAIDLIHTHGMWMMINVYPGWVARKHSIPLVVSPRGTLTKYALASGSRVKKAFWPLVQRRALEPAVCFHATSEAEYEDIRRIGFRQPVAVIPNGIDLGPLLPRQFRGRRTLLFLARIHPNKGLDMLLPAWARLEADFPDWELRIVGSDHGYHGTSGHLDEMKQLARNLGLSRVEFEGPRYGAEKHAAFRNADLYVLPSYSENFGMTVAEALSQETPTIVMKGAPWQELESKGAGWWIDIGVESLVAALKRAMSEPPEQLAAMGVKGRNWMEREFLWRSIARGMSETYHWLCNPTHSRPSSVRVD